MKNSITLSQIVKQKCLTYNKTQKTQQNNKIIDLNIQYTKKWPLISHQKQRTIHESKQGNTLFQKYKKMREKSLNSNKIELNLNEYEKLKSNKISQIDFNTKRYKQVSIRSSLNKNLQNKANSKSSVDEYGFSTLMDIDLSQIGQSKQLNNIKRDSQSKNSRLSSSSLSVQSDILKMRQKLHQIQKNHLSIPNYHPYSPYSHPNLKNCSSQYYQQAGDPWLIQLKSQINKDKAKKVSNAIIKICLRKLLKQIDIYDSLMLLVNRENKKRKRQAFGNWKQYIQKQGEKRNMMKMIKQRVINKRKDRFLQKQLYYLTNAVHQI